MQSLSVGWRGKDVETAISPSGLARAEGCGRAYRMEGEGSSIG